MDSLERLLSSRVKARILRLLFGPGAHELHVRELARQSGLSDATVRQELKRLASLQLVEARISGNRTYIRANPNHSLAPEIGRLVLKTSGLVDALRLALAQPGVGVAFVFGSMADGSEKPESDVDLMIVGDLSLREASKLLSGVGSTIGRDINPHVYSSQEFARRRTERDHFLTSVLEGPKLFVIGSEHELEAVGG